MNIRDLPNVLTPHLVSAMPLLANVTPFLLVLGVFVVAGAVLAAIRIQRFALRVSGDDKHGGQGRDVLIVLRKSEYRLRRVRIGILILATLVVAVWLWIWRTHDAPELTELIFIVLGAGILAPTYIAVKVLSGAFETAAKLVEDRLVQ